MGAHRKGQSPRPGSPRQSDFPAKIYRASKNQQAAGSGREKGDQGSARYSGERQGHPEAPPMLAAGDRCPLRREDPQRGVLLQPTCPGCCWLF